MYTYMHAYIHTYIHMDKTLYVYAGPVHEEVEAVDADLQAELEDEEGGEEPFGDLQSGDYLIL